MSRISDIFLTALAPAVWGSTYIVTTEALPGGHPLTLAALRALPAGILLLALTRSLPPLALTGRVLVLGALNFGLFWTMLFIAADRLPGGVAATPLQILGGSIVLASVWAGQVTNRRPPGKARSARVVLAPENLKWGPYMFLASKLGRLADRRRKRNVTVQLCALSEHRLNDLGLSRLDLIGSAPTTKCQPVRNHPRTNTA